MDQQNSVAVLGAGMAGAAAARRLAEGGLPVHVFDKGRGVGGRMATRRVTIQGPADAVRHIDHGAPFLRAHGPAFSGQVDDWRRRGVVAPWGGEGRMVGVPGMTAPVRDLLCGLPVATGFAVARIARDAAGWRLTDAAGVAHGPFAAIAVTFPAPQATALLHGSGLALAGTEVASYAPCWSLLLAFETAATVDAALRDTIAEPDDGPIGLIARDGTKPGRAGTHTVVVHATPGWSRSHLEAEREAVAALMTRALSERLGVGLAPDYAAAHRWRYARVETALGQPCLYDPAQRLGAGGDWCLGARIEAAYDSGVALADAILADLRPAA